MPLEIIKVCGITRIEDALFAAQHGATALGLNFYPGSPRYVDFGRGAIIASVVPKHVLKVGVFVDESADRIRETAHAAHLDVVQLHGQEAPVDCELLAPLRVWKALRVADGWKPEALADYQCEAFLLDTAADNGAHGGTGRTFPWEMARRAAQYGRIIVAGGLDGSNVGEAIRIAGPWGVDAASRLERTPGIKDTTKVREYLESARKGLDG